MKIRGKAYCFFEQSGTFKQEFIKMGIPAEDLDIQNNFGQTDHQIDLFAEIENAYGGGASVFDSITYDDLTWVFQISKAEPLRNWKGIDWLNAHHFDYRGLIEMGLALEAPASMYKTE